MSITAVLRAFPDRAIAVRLTWRARLALWGERAVVLTMIGLALFLGVNAEGHGERWLVVVGLVVLAGGLTATSILYQWRDLRLYRALARAPRPIVVQLTDMRFVTNPGYAKLWVFEGELDGRPIAGEQRLKARKGAHGAPIERWLFEEPLMVLGGDRVPRALALADARGRVRLFKADFHPLLLSEDERTRIIDAAQSVPAGRENYPANGG